MSHFELLLGASLVIGMKEEEAAPRDTDGDGVTDNEDKCPDQAGPPPDGCPVKDRDGDGVTDDMDRCPDVAASTPDGCPEDSDGDGVTDDKDRCPKVPARTPDGCPGDRLAARELDRRGAAAPVIGREQLVLRDALSAQDLGQRPIRQLLPTDLAPADPQALDKRHAGAFGPAVSGTAGHAALMGIQGADDEGEDGGERQARATPLPERPCSAASRDHSVLTDHDPVSDQRRTGIRIGPALRAELNA